MISFKILTVVFSLFYVCNGKDYLLEVEDEDYNGNEYDVIQIRFG